MFRVMLWVLGKQLPRKLQMPLETFLFCLDYLKKHSFTCLVSVLLTIVS